MSKTNTGLVEFVKGKLGIPYVYGAKGEVLTKSKYDWLKKTYPDMVWDSDVKKVGQVCVDCSGLPAWYTGIIKNSTTYKNEAVKRDGVHSISTISAAPVGAAVWRQGHIGVYIGNGYAIEARGSKYGVVKTKVKSRDWTHWFLFYDITYDGAEAVEYFERYAGTSGSIVDGLRTIGATSTFAYRTKIAKANGIKAYVGTAAQNTKMLNLLKTGKLIKP
jgi:hypothetical protein